MDNKKNIYEKIRKLFQMGKSPNLNEAAIAIGKAQELMREHGLSYGEIHYTQDEKQTGRNKPAWEAIIYRAVCMANNCLPCTARGWHTRSYTIMGREINVFLSMEMFDYLTGTVKRLAKEQCRGKGRKYNNDFKLAAASALRERLEEYGERVSWAVDREAEIRGIREHYKIEMNRSSRKFVMCEREAVEAGEEAGKNIGLHKQTGIEETRLIGKMEENRL